MTGWCGQQEAFTYVSVDLGTLHRVKAILVKVRQLKGQPGGWGSPRGFLLWSAAHKTLIGTAA